MTNKLSSKLKAQTPLNFPEYKKHFDLGVSNAYTFTNIDPNIWYQNFIYTVKCALEMKTYFPIYRMGDGEYSFAVGNYLDLTPYTSLTLKENIKKLLRKVIKNKHSHQSGYQEVGYENYADEEYDSAKIIFINSLKVIAAKGYLGLGLDDSPLYRRYFPDIIDWFEENGIPFHELNYIHVYAIYAILRSNTNSWLFKDKRILVISGFIENQENVKLYLLGRGAHCVDFKLISKTKSMLDVINVSSFYEEYDVIFVSAGVGAVNILEQLQPTRALCIDIGFILRIWGNENLKWDRPFCVPDIEFDINKARFL